MPRRSLDPLNLAKTCIAAALLLTHSHALLEADEVENVISFAPIQVGAQATQIWQASKSSFSLAITTGDFKQTNDCSTSVTDTCYISVTFYPSANGVRAGALMLEGPNFVPSKIIGLVGVAIGPPKLVVSSTVVNFDAQKVMTSSPQQQLTLSNIGGADLHLGNIITTSEFQRDSSCQSSLAPGASCIVSVAFQPLGAGSRSGVLVIDDASGQLLKVVGMSGLGIGTPQLAISKAAVVFNPQRLSAIPRTETVMVTNVGDAPVANLSISVEGEYSEASTCGTTLEAGGSCELTISFKPTFVGICEGSINLKGDGSSNKTISVSGRSEPDTNITAIWANEGGDKVTRDELRASQHVENLTGTVLNRAWDGESVKLSSARNEVVSFNLVLESATKAANNVAVKFDLLTGAGGATISSVPTSGDGVFNWVGRNIELFYVRYLQIKGLSFFGYYKGDERQVPVRFQRPWTGEGVASGGWTDRPDHDKFYPDIMVPLELTPTFTIAQGQNQSIWSDIYVPKDATSGTYTGKISVSENGTVTHEIPVSLTVQNFSLPDSPKSKTMINLDTTDIMWRYVTGPGGYANWAGADGQKIARVTDKYFELFHRHKLSVIGENECPVADRPCDTGLPRLTGSLFTAQNGYDGPGVNTPEGVYSIGTYGTWGAASYGVPDWKHDKGLFQTHIDNYASWFAQNLPNTDYFLYLEDEPSRSDYNQVETWAEWMAQDPGPGKNMMSLATVNPVDAKTYMPTLAIPVMTASIGACATSSWCDSQSTLATASDFYKNTPGRKFWGYNDGRPATGTAVTEDDGISMRILPWTQFKMGIDRWFYWYANVNTPWNWFQTSTTWGSVSYFDWSLGQYGWDGTSNGNGLLVYPGTDVNNPSDSYGVNGPFASLRLKEWRRGVQDTDYLALAQQIDPTATQAIVSQAIPKALWENPAPGGDPSYFVGSVSWSSNPDDWEAKRAQLTALIATYCVANPTSNICSAR